MTETETAPVLRLFSDGLLSKHGFNDGDSPDVWLDWCDERGIDYTALRPWRSAILPDLVRRYLLPKIGQDVKVIKIGTNHNPIRAETIDGIDVTGCWYETGSGESILAPVNAEVTMEQVFEVARATGDETP